MLEILHRIGGDLVDRVTGAMHFRIYMQPVMALLFATISGIKDAREGNPPFFRALFTVQEHRREMLRDLWKSVGKVFILAAILDAIYQVVEQRFIYPFEIIIVAIILAILPYLIFRGVVTRIATMFGIHPQK